MNSQLIIKAIEVALGQNVNVNGKLFTDDEVQVLRTMQQQVAAVVKQIVDDWEIEYHDTADDLHIIHDGHALDIANVMTYDEYGKARRRYGDQMDVDKYIAAVNTALMYGLPDRLLKENYSYVADLWRDNEADGCNNPDGTFRK